MFLVQPVLIRELVEGCRRNAKILIKAYRGTQKIKLVEFLNLNQIRLGLEKNVRRVLLKLLV